MMMCNRVTSAAVVFAFVAYALAPSLAVAHGQPTPIALYGGSFGIRTLYCLRALSAAAQRCFSTALAAHLDCMNRRLAGAPCDSTARDARLGAAWAGAQAVVATACTGGQLTELNMIGFDETRADIGRACDQAASTTSITYDVAVRGGALRTDDATLRDCVGITAESSRKLLRTIVRTDDRMLARMALRLLAPSRKQTMMSTAGARIAAARQALALQMHQSCPSFSTIYGETEDALLGRLIAPGACVVGSTYVQDAVACPLPRCGNGVTDVGEQCDDGNGVDDDLCGNNCAWTAAAAEP